MKGTWDNNRDKGINNNSIDVVEVSQIDMYTIIMKLVVSNLSDKELT